MVNNTLSSHVSGVLLDCDGTIFPNVEAAHEHCCGVVFSEALHALNISNDTDLISCVWQDQLGKGINNYFNVLIERFAEEFPDSANSINTLDSNELEKSYQYKYISLTQKVASHDPTLTDLEQSFFEPRKGFFDLVQGAKSSGIPVAVVSNATQEVLEATLSTLDKSVDFDLIIGSDTVVKNGGKIKPSPDPYIQAMDELDIDPENAFGYEDTKSGLNSLTDAGVRNRVFCNNMHDCSVTLLDSSSYDVQIFKRDSMVVGRITAPSIQLEGPAPS